MNIFSLDSAVMNSLLPNMSVSRSRLDYGTREMRVQIGCMA